MAASTAIDYNEMAASYARHRAVHPGVATQLIATAGIGPETCVLDVGCGTGNYAKALAALTACQISGVEPSREMLRAARESAIWNTLVHGSAEQLPVPDHSVDLVMSTDVIHHVGDRPAYFREAARVLKPGGRLVTVTDSAADIARRRPLTSHFPETAAIELSRYPSLEVLTNEMTAAGFTAISREGVELEYELIDIQPYRDRVFSSLTLLDDAAFQRGLARLASDLILGPISALSLYTLLWGTIPARLH
jgi:SAM-dependent methyltransferase